MVMAPFGTKPPVTVTIVVWLGEPGHATVVKTLYVTEPLGLPVVLASAAETVKG
jgi:hypothetical protein